MFFVSSTLFLYTYIYIHIICLSILILINVRIFLIFVLLLVFIYPKIFTMLPIISLFEFYKPYISIYIFTTCTNILLFTCHILIFSKYLFLSVISTINQYFPVIGFIHCYRLDKISRNHNCSIKNCNKFITCNSLTL